MRGSLPETVSRRVRDAIGREPTGFRVVSGGDISHSGRLSFAEPPDLFVKWTEDSSAVLTAEHDGLMALIGAGSSLVVPRPVSLVADSKGRFSLLLMEWLEPTPATTSYWTALGRGLAALHGVSGSSYGFESDNFIGRIAQRNEWRDKWPDFFAEMRLEPQRRLAIDNGLWHSVWTPMFDQLLKHIEELLPADPVPALVHGDLWSGNAMSTTRGPAVFDPATYYGHVEVDLAMSELFGGFAAAFRSGYQDVVTLDPGYPERKEIYNLYHLINHLNHFGDAYASGVQRVLRRFRP